MNVLYATTQFGRGYGQGAERYLTVLSDGLRTRGHRAVILGGDPEHRGPRLPAGEPVPGERNVLHYPSRGWMSVEGLPPTELAGVLRRERPDIVHVASPAHVGIGIITAARAVNIPVAVTIMDYWWLCPKQTLAHREGTVCSAKVTWPECLRCIATGHSAALPRGLARIPVLRDVALPLLVVLRASLRGLPPDEITRWRRRQEILLAVLNDVQAVIFPSRAAREIVAPHLQHDRTHDVPYGLEPHWFEHQSHEPRRTAPLPPDRMTIGYAGALAEHKGVHLLLEAIARLGWTKTRVRLAGGGEDARYVRRLRRRARGLSVEFAGRIPSPEMPAFLRSLDVLVVPSTWPENLPIIALEAHAVGVPLLASRVAGIAETITNPAHLFEVNSAASLADCLAAWAASPSAGRAAPVSTADEMVERTLAVYRRCLSSSERQG